MQDRQLCPVCYQCGVKSYLQSYQINLDEAIVLCQQKKCTYPLRNGNTQNLTTYNRPITQLPSSQDLDANLQVPQSQLKLQAKVASHMKTCGYRLQHDAKAIQTGSPQLRKKFKTASTRNRECNQSRETSATAHQTGFLSRLSSSSQHTWRKRGGSIDSCDRDSSLNSSADNLDSNSENSSGSGPSRAYKKQNMAFPAFQFSKSNDSSKSTTPNELERLCSSENEINIATPDPRKLNSTYTAVVNGCGNMDNCSERTQNTALPNTVNGYQNSCNTSFTSLNGLYLPSVDNTIKYDATLSRLAHPINVQMDSVSYSEVQPVNAHLTSVSYSKNKCTGSFIRPELSKTCDTRTVIAETCNDANTISTHIHSIGNQKLEEKFEINQIQKDEKLYNTAILEGKNTFLATSTEAQLTSSIEEKVENILNNTEHVSIVKNMMCPATDSKIKSTQEQSLINTLTSEEMHSYPTLFPQWMNNDAQCWLDVLLCLTCHNETMKQLVYTRDYQRNNQHCLIYKLLLAHYQAQQIVMNLMEQKKHCCNASGYVPMAGSKLLNKSCKERVPNGSGERTVKFGGDKTILSGKLGKEDYETTDVGGFLDELGCSGCTYSGVGSVNPNQAEAEMATLLNTARQDIWQSLKPKLKCERGQHESPVFALPLLLRQSPQVENLFKMKYSFTYNCSICKHSEEAEYENVLPTLPELVPHFRIAEPAHKKKCPKCGNISDERKMTYKQLPECMCLHFMTGVCDTRWSDLQFQFDGHTYTVTGMVQYITNPNHFIAWLRNPHGDTWLECDDLDTSNACTYSTEPPNVPGSQVHMVMWERLAPTPPEILASKPLEGLVHGPGQLNPTLATVLVNQDTRLCSTNCHTSNQLAQPNPALTTVLTNQEYNTSNQKLHPGETDSMPNSENDNGNNKINCRCRELQLNNSLKTYNKALDEKCNCDKQIAQDYVQSYAGAANAGHGYKALLTLKNEDSRRKCFPTSKPCAIEDERIKIFSTTKPDVLLSNCASRTAMFNTNKPEAILSSHTKCLGSLMSSRTSSPCSSVSTETGSLQLPNFVAYTPVSVSVQRPIPCKSVDTDNRTIASHSRGNATQNTDGSTIHRSLNISPILPGLSVSGIQGVVTASPTYSCRMSSNAVPVKELPNVCVRSTGTVGLPAATGQGKTYSKISGQVSEIHASSVFCKPVKTSGDLVPTDIVPEHQAIIVPRNSDHCETNANNTYVDNGTNLYVGPSVQTTDNPPSPSVDTNGVYTAVKINLNNENTSVQTAVTSEKVEAKSANKCKITGSYLSRIAAVSPSVQGTMKQAGGSPIPGHLIQAATPILPTPVVSPIHLLLGQAVTSNVPCVTNSAVKVQSLRETTASRRQPNVQTTSEETKKFTNVQIPTKGTTPHAMVQTKAGSSNTTSSKQSKFKLPLSYRKKNSNYVRDAFRSLDKGSNSSNSTTTSANSSMISPVLNGGNLTYLSTVKQYLLNKTTANARPEMRSKFEGLNLFSIHDLNNPKHPTPDVITTTSSATDSSKSSGNVTASASPISAGVSESKQLTGLNVNYLKRKLENVNSLIKESEQKKAKMDFGRLKQISENRSSVRNSSLERQSTCVKTPGLPVGNTDVPQTKPYPLRNTDASRPKQRIGGKNMALVRQWANQTKGGLDGNGAIVAGNGGISSSNKNLVNKEDLTNKNFTKQHNNPVQTCDIKKQHNNPVQTCDIKASGNTETELTDTILHDLYDALNIPYTSVQDTMNVIMSDVDDMFSIIDTDEILTTQLRSGSPLSCMSSPVPGNQPKTGCWVHSPGRNSV